MIARLVRQTQTRLPPAHPGVPVSAMPGSPVPTAAPAINALQANTRPRMDPPLAHSVAREVTMAHQQLQHARIVRQTLTLAATCAIVSLTAPATQAQRGPTGDPARCALRGRSNQRQELHSAMRARRIPSRWRGQ